MALLATLPFVLPAPGTAARLLDANGGNAEPALYVILLWLTRGRPVWGGLILGIGFLQREFTIYALLALLTLEAIDRSLFTRAGIGRRATMLRTAAEVWLVVQWLKQYSSAAGPGTSLANIYKPKDNLLELVSRTCLDAPAAAGGVARLFTEHWPVLFGTHVLPLTDFGIESQRHQGLPWSGILPAAVMAIAGAGVIWRLGRERRWRPEYRLLCLPDDCRLVLGNRLRRWPLRRGRLRDDAIRPAVAHRCRGPGRLVAAPRSPRALVRTWMCLLVAWVAVGGLAGAGLLSSTCGALPSARSRSSSAASRRRAFTTPRPTTGSPTR